MGEYPSLPAILLESADRWGAKTALLHKVKGQYQPISYLDLLRNVHEAAAALVSCGAKAGHRIAIMGENCPEWAYCDWAILSLGAITVPIYPTFLRDQVGHILADSGATLVIAGDPKCAERIQEASEKYGLSVVVILLSGEYPGTLSFHRAISDGKDTVLTYETWRQGCQLTRPQDIATLIYTSGTTGDPKGAELTHEAFTFLCKAIVANLPIDHRDRFFSFLPLSHVYERMAGHFLPISCGAEIAYAGSLRSLAQDIIEAKPTVILAVPRFLESVKAKVEQVALESPWPKKNLFCAQRSRGAERLRHNLRPVGPFGGLLDKLVSSKIREKFGGRLRFFVSGGAALPTAVAEFYGAFGIQILQGYGLTETAPVISVNHPDRSVYTSVGEILPGVEVRIASDGEVLMRGPSRMVGYYNKPEETAAMIDEEGWLHTGDLGRLENNRLWITGRKKEIIVLANGKNVSPTTIESRLKGSPLIDEAMIVGDDEEYIAALLVPNFENLRHFCQSHGLSSSHQHEMVEYAQVRDRIKADVDEVNRELPDYERVKRWKLMPEGWSIESGEITPTMKLKRGFIKEKWAHEIEALHKR